MLNVIFDMDGVIFDSEKTLLDCWMETSSRYGIDEEAVRETYIKCIGTNDKQTREIYEGAFLQVLGRDKLEALWVESMELHRSRYADGRLPMKPGVKELLEYLKEMGACLGIASSSKKATVEAQVTAAGIREYFKSVIGGDAVTISKPNPEIYLIACRELGVDPKMTFAIEDSYNGIRASHAAGMRPIMVPDIIPADEEMKELSEVICKDLFEVEKFFGNLG